MSEPSISFFVEGIPKAQPRPRAFARNFGGKWMARVYDAGTAEEWKSRIAVVAKPFIPSEPIKSPVELRVSFNMPRPKGHFRTGKRAGELREGMPYQHTSTPDLDNLIKAVKDCLTQIGIWRDDAQVSSEHISKTYALGHSVGAAIVITPL